MVFDPEKSISARFPADFLATPSDRKMGPIGAGEAALI